MSNTEKNTLPPEEHVSQYGRPGDLKITDLRTATVGWNGWRFPIVRIDTNQGLSGYGEVRDGASKTYALMLKSRLLGENPCNVDKVFRKIKQFGHHARQGGGVCAVEMALMDLAGKAYGVPAYALWAANSATRSASTATPPTNPPGRPWAKNCSSGSNAASPCLKWTSASSR